MVTVTVCTRKGLDRSYRRVWCDCCQEWKEAKSRNLLEEDCSLRMWDTRAEITDASGSSLISLRTRWLWGGLECAGAGEPNAKNLVVTISADTGVSNRMIRISQNRRSNGRDTERRVHH